MIPPAGGRVTLLPGQAATAHGLLASSNRRDLTVVMLRASGSVRDVAVPAVVVARGRRVAERGCRRPRRCCPLRRGLLPGLTVGDTSRLTREAEAGFRAAGTQPPAGGVRGESTSDTCVASPHIVRRRRKTQRIPYGRDLNPLSSTLARPPEFAQVGRDFCFWCRSCDRRSCACWAGQVEQIWSTASMAVKWGHGLLQVHNAVRACPRRLQIGCWTVVAVALGRMGGLSWGHHCVGGLGGLAARCFGGN
jgi:hypothetical protein